MKQTLLFAAIMILCGSLKMDDRKKCPERVKVTYYFRGKVQGSCYIGHSCKHKSFLYDSVTYQVSY